MRHTWLVIVAVASLVLNVAVVGAYIFQLNRGGPRPSRPPLAGLRREMHGQAREVFKKSWPEMKRLGEERERLQAELMQEVMKSEPSQQRIDSLADEMGRLHAQSAKIIARDARAVTALLPAEQRERFLRNFGPFGAGHRGARGIRMMRGHRGIPGPGPDEPGMEPPPEPPAEGGE
jgi:hypothetical protein